MILARAAYIAQRLAKPIGQGGGMRYAGSSRSGNIVCIEIEAIKHCTKGVANQAPRLW